MDARFSHIIKTAGRPETYLALTDPGKDRTLQKLVKAGRVMTVHQNARGGKPDFGEAGFKAGHSRQYLVFPRSIKRFAGKRVVGIKYELLEDAPKSRPSAKPKPRPKTRVPTVSGKIIAFPTPQKEREESAEVTKIKTRVRRAIKALEAGKQVAAFHLLREILES